MGEVTVDARHATSLSVVPASTPGARPGAQPAEQAAEGKDRVGVLAGTASEQAPGVGGTGDHPTPAAMVDPDDGGLHVAGEPPAGTSALSASPEGDTTDRQAGDVTDPQARARLNAVVAPAPFHTKRPDLGTE